MTVFVSNEINIGLSMDFQTNEMTAIIFENPLETVIEKHMLTSNKKVCPMCEGSGYLKEKRENAILSRANEILESSSKTSDRKFVPNFLLAPGDSAVEKTSKNHRDSPDRFESTADYVASLNHNHHEPEKCANLQETLRLVVLKLKENNWETSVSALLNVVHMSRIQPDVIDPSMPLITRSLHSLMKNVRPQVVRTACQIAEELFKTMQCTQKPEFDELVGTLLQKTSHMNKAVRQDATRALDAMVLYIPATHCISVMASCGACHKNPIVRSTVSRLLYDVVCAVGVESFFTTSTFRDSRKKTFLMCLEFLNDTSTETRSNSRRLLQLLMRHSDFDEIFSQDVDRSLIKRNEKKLVSLKYEQSLVN